MHGFVKVCAATVPIKVADVEFNTQRITEAIDESYKSGCSITVFPELCVCGYTCGDLFNQRLLISSARKAVENIALATAGKDILVFVGAPLVYGGKLYNCAVAISDGKILGVVPKTYLPNYGEFYEQRYFAGANEETGAINIADYSVPFGTKLIFKAESNENLTVAAELCEDLWAPLSPSVSHALSGANIIVNLSCSNEIADKSDYRRDLIKTQSAKLICGYVYANAGDGESTTDCVFAGHNIISEKGAVLAESKPFSTGLTYSEIDVQLLADKRKKMSSRYFRAKTEGYTFIKFSENKINCELTRAFPERPFVPCGKDKLELLLTIQAKGLEKRLVHTGAKTLIIGVSGGLDSALALLVACRTMKILNRSVKDVIAVSMPGFGSSDKTKSNASRLIEALKVTSKTIPIERSVKRHFEDIGHDENICDATYENAQARMRTLILMDLANEHGGLVVGTGDLSELALGWATYNGDHMSMYSVNSSVPKTLVKELVSYESERLDGDVKKVLADILNTEISPELLPLKNGVQSQSTENVIGPYVLHDFYLYYAVNYGFTPEKIAYIAERTFKGTYSTADIKKWLKVFYKRFFSQQFKRSCSPDGVKCGEVSLSPRADWKMPSDAVAALWLKDIN